MTTLRVYRHGPAHHDANPALTLVAELDSPVVPARGDTLTITGNGHKVIAREFVYDGRELVRVDCHTRATIPAAEYLTRRQDVLL